ncbi:hypothetical protein F4777DRAFT_587197 [Nemania sp. FL0916]|nr:hypothetical protein F4777DRAFT_587197 [Nemania sp. FL0916]
MLTPHHRSAQQQSSNYPTPPPAQSFASHNPHSGSTYGRPVSSLYSQPSPQAAVFAAQQLRNDAVNPGPLEISPPSSPDISSPREGPYPGDVSPIDETPDIPQPTQERYIAPKKTELRSNIPMMRRERRKNSDAAANALRESKSRDRATSRPYGHDVRWDPRTGEPTTSAKGRPSQVSPQDYAHDLVNRAVSTSPSPQNRPPPPSTTSLRDRLRIPRQASASPQPEPTPRPEWRGASGRAAIVPPVRDNKFVAPLAIPRRSSKRVGRNLPMLSPIESMGSEAASSPLQISARVSREDDKGSATFSGAALPRQPQSPDIGLDSPSAYPTPPPFSEDEIRIKQSRARDPTATAFAHAPPLRIPSNDKAIRRKPARAPSGQYPESPRFSEHDVASHQAPISDPAEEWTQPPSRFSITTYATSNHTSSRRGSIDEDAPPLPAPSRLDTPTIPEVSILSRGRPIASKNDQSPRSPPAEPVKINLDSSFYTTRPVATSSKAVPPGLHVVTGGVPEESDLTSSAESTAPAEKSLPPAPPEVSAKDRVTELNAHLEALGNRRININTAIRKMTEMMPVDNILASAAVVRKREKEKHNVEQLRAELADIDRQSYELGLKLHRAYKRLDRDSDYESPTLWVKRVTG